MLDTIVKSIIRKLDVHSEEVRVQRIKVERERASGAPRTIATAILKHPEGYATSPREAAESAQKAYAKARSDWEQHGIPMLIKLATLAVARERRDETAAVFREHEATEAVRKATKVHPDFRRLNDTMIAHGVQTGHAATATNGMVAIVSDILMWAGADPELMDPDSPLRAILEIYAARLILTPGQFGDRSKSKPGVPVRQVKYTDPEYYMFNEAAQATADVPAGTKPEPTTSPGVSGDEADALEADIVETEHGLEPAVAEAAPVFPIVLGDAPSAVSAAISPDFARRIAETVFDNNPYKMGIYWPKGGYEVGDYDLERLIPALEQRMASGEGWSGVERFLAAARLDQARQFIEEERRIGVESLAAGIARGDARGLADARAAGFEV